ncbi:hypothetical protein TraAM80_09478 [Trypanosoma rangeli]|uniref:Uncharacterized protein n=1 Tax=Trypanosoma rangeli TaxID=5698 RepID=A0A422MV90_TRYRA|nr:uncharacterized protein TraAM80_09478 [Trypanosoma rangeli]RNE97154.1 hypothetical protein TraAM80_09478 [Trypanosoma rangeli]|eukprot:RNE97154.1 hypothetical protein TraAM80_09478 [Trypanosoma rangeli]
MHSTKRANAPSSQRGRPAALCDPGHSRGIIRKAAAHCLGTAALSNNGGARPKLRWFRVRGNTAGLAAARGELTVSVAPRFVNHVGQLRRRGAQTVARMLVGARHPYPKQSL